MARFRWRRYRRYRRYPRRFRRRGYRRGRVINRSPRSRVKVNFMGEAFVDIPWQSNSATSHQLYISPFYQNVTPLATRHVNFLPASLCSQASYLTFASCYEQCRLIGCKVIVTCNTPIGAGQNFTDVTIYSAISRQFSLYDMEHNMIPWATVGASSSSKRVTFVNNTVNKLGRACYASDLQERIDFVDSKCTYPNGTELTPTYPDGTHLNDQYISCLECQTDSDSNVAHPKFCPMFVFQGNTSDVRAANRTLKVLVRISGTFEFRGPRFGNATSGAAKVAPAADAKLPPAEGADDMDVVLPDDPSQPAPKRHKLDEDDDVCLPEEERSTSAAAKVLRDEDDDEDIFDRFESAPKQPDWRDRLKALGTPPKLSGAKFAEGLFRAFADRNGDGQVDASELARVLAPLRAIPRPIMDRLLAKAIKASDQAEKDAPMRDTCHPYDEITERAMDEEFGATAAAETASQAKNVSTGGTPGQK